VTYDRVARRGITISRQPGEKPTFFIPAQLVPRVAVLACAGLIHGGHPFDRPAELAAVASSATRAVIWDNAWSGLRNALARR
jgi:hypothetical protein